MTNITFPLSEANVAQCMAERDAEIERLRDEIKNMQIVGHETIERLRALRCSCQIADHISDECARLGKCKERAIRKGE